MKLLTVDTVETARQKLLDCTRDWKIPVERIGVPGAPGRVLAEDIFAPEDIPCFRRSAVDGYAVFAADTAGAGEALPVFLKIAGTVEMGRAAGFAVRRGECAGVPTGGMIPEGADAVVMAEYCEPFERGSVAIYESAATGSHVARIGEDVKQGALLLRRGTRIYSREAGAFAAAGITEVPVYAPLRLTLISTGDELVSPSETPGPGQVRDINTWALGTLALQSGYRVIARQTVKDDKAALETAVRSAMEQSDIAALSGGSSQGEKDMTAEVFSAIARPGIFCHGLALKPGKPTILAYDHETRTILAGLPGHPVSALAVWRALFSWLADTLTGRREPFPVPAKMACNIAGSPGRETWQPVALVREGGGYLAEPVFGKAGMMSALTGADGYVIIGLNKEGLQKGEDVWVHLLGDG